MYPDDGRGGAPYDLSEGEVLTPFVDHLIMAKIPPSPGFCSKKWTQNSTKPNRHVGSIPTSGTNNVEGLGASLAPIFLPKESPSEIETDPVA